MFEWLTPDQKTWLFVAAIGIVVGTIIPPIRAIIAPLMSQLIWPVLKAISLAGAKWVFWAGKKVVDAHILLFENLSKPHDAIFKTLEVDEDGKPMK